MAIPTPSAVRVVPREAPPRDTLADCVRRLGDIPLERIAMHPAPGQATEKDLVHYLEATNKRLYELVDGTLVEKVMGAPESVIAAALSHLIWSYLEDEDIGLPVGADGPIRLESGLVRLPDVAFISWKRLGSDEMPASPILSAIPELAVEVLSESSTKAEMDRKVADYFAAGVQLVWLIDLKRKSAVVYTSPKRRKDLTIDDSLDGGKVLPGFLVPLKKLFAHLNRRPKNGKRSSD